MKKVLIVEPVPMLKRAMRRFVLMTFTQQEVIIVEADDMKQASMQCRIHSPNIVILSSNIDCNQEFCADALWQIVPQAAMLFVLGRSRTYLVKQLARQTQKNAFGCVSVFAADETYCAALTAMANKETYIDRLLKQEFQVDNTPVLTPIELLALVDVASGLTDKAIAAKRHLTVRGVQKRIASAADKLLGKRTAGALAQSGGNMRMQLVLTAMRKGILNVNDLAVGA